VVFFVKNSSLFVGELLESTDAPVEDPDEATAGEDRAPNEST
jgi:hypothetical protein